MIDLVIGGLYGDYNVIRKITKINQETKRISYIERPHHSHCEHKIKNCTINTFLKWAIDRLN
jgi:hypothetical protein